MKKPKFIKNFLDQHELYCLNNWTLENYSGPFFVDPKMNDDISQTRFTTRHPRLREDSYKNQKVNYPKEVYDVQKRLIKTLKLKHSHIAPPQCFDDGICTTLAFSPGSCSRHVDPIYYNNTYTLHCNFITQNPEEGGITFIEGKGYKFAEKDAILYLSSHMEHEVSECFGNIPRILWVFGFCIDESKKNEIFNSISYI
jgi:hypothetical protein